MPINITARAELSSAAPEAMQPLRKRITALRVEVLKRSATGQEADKAFFDELSGNL